MLKIEDLKEGVVLVNKENIPITIDCIINNMVFATESDCDAVLYSKLELIKKGFVIKQPEPKYYMGFEVRSYEGEGIIVSVSDDSKQDCIDDDFVCILLRVEIDHFIVMHGNNKERWTYAVLATCNNHNLKLKA